MKKKYRFRKMFFKCHNNKVIEDCYEVTNAFRRREYALQLIKPEELDPNHRYLWQKNTPKPKVSIEGFYLVHESLFDELLKEHARD